MTVSFVIPMKPMGKERPRLSRGIVYTPAKTQSYENFIKACYIEQCGDAYFGERSIELHVKAYVLPLTKFRKSETAAALEGELKPNSKPDADNILKIILDALNELAYADDRTIYKMSVERIYSEIPHTEIIITDGLTET